MRDVITRYGYTNSGGSPWDLHSMGAGLPFSAIRTQL